VNEPKNYFGQVMFKLDDHPRFNRGLSEMLSAVNAFWRRGIFIGDNLLTFSKNLSFLDDARFMDAIKRHAETEIERSIIWRTAVLVWAARNGLRREGAFVECGCYRGTSARIICDAVEFNKTDKDYFLYDVFDYPEGGAPFSKMPGMGPTLFEEVKARFADIPRAKIIKGLVPDSVIGTAPDRIAFLHIDMNNVAPEIAALDLLFERMVPGGMIILDDYGYIPYLAQRDAERDWFAKRGYDVLELPTSQGLIVR
jgi:O-methyltransferase